MRQLLVWVTCLLVSCLADELLKNGGFEDTSNWDCWNIKCSLTDDKYSGSKAFQVENRHNYYEGPSQPIEVKSGYTYQASGYIKLMNDNPSQPAGQPVLLEVDYLFPDNTHDYITAAAHNYAKVADGWIHIQGQFETPTRPLQSARIYYQGPDPSVSYKVDETSVSTLGGQGDPASARAESDKVINQIRKSDIVLTVNTPAGINRADVKIHVLQTKKSFPFGTAVAAYRYNDASQNKYRDFIHQHFNWAVPENALKWPMIEQYQGQKNFQPALDMINGLRSHGIKVRGHNLVWSVDQFVQDWVKRMTGDTLRNTVKQHIQETMAITKGLLEHWDVNNENLHGQFYQNQLHDPSYNLEIFRIAHAADPTVKLFLNDYDVVAGGGTTGSYLDQGKEFKAANVGMYGMGVQCHFGLDQDPNYYTIKRRLDTLAQVGVPLWTTELDVQSADENKRADYLEHALRALYGHPAIEGILLWGFWDQAHWRKELSALVKGNNLELTAAGRRFLDLLENQWMTDETHALTADNKLTVRGFHGDYEVHVQYQGRDLPDLKTTFTLDKTGHSQTIDVKV